jgi:NTP pyrophosphatase (non-canonical NTP hydrolase)
MTEDAAKQQAPEWPELAEFKQQFRQFTAERDWAQFHSPKNLAMALAGEAGELLELFQWLTQEESCSLPDDARQAVAHEIADIQIYLAAISDRLGIDIGPAVAGKMKLNAEKYPPDLARGTTLKYSKLVRSETE